MRISYVSNDASTLGFLFESEIFHLRQAKLHLPEPDAHKTCHGTVPDRPVQHIIFASAFLRITTTTTIRAAVSLQMPAKIHLSCRSLWQSLGCPLFCSFSFKWRNTKICACNIHVAFQYSIQYTHGRTCFARPSAQERPCIQEATDVGNAYKI